MDAFRIFKRLPAEVTEFDTLYRNQPWSRQIVIRDRAGQVAPRRRVLRVLVVADEQGTPHELVEMVRRGGHSARLAVDGLSALRVAADQHPDIVLLDIETPVTDGCQIARQLRLDSLRDACFIIAVSGDVDGERRQECIQAGIDLLLIKPVDPSIVETLLMLECFFVNRSQSDNSTGLTSNGSSQLAQGKLPSRARDGVGRITRSRLAAGTSGGLQPS